MTSLDIVTFGEAMGLFVAETPGDLAEVERFARRMAGCETNVAVGLARLGLRVGWVSRLGRDPFGRFIRATLVHEGVDCSHVADDPDRSTGIMFKAKTVDGSDSAIHYMRKNSAASQLTSADYDADYFRSARLLHATGVSAALSSANLEFAHQVMAEMAGSNRTISFDPNLRPLLWPSESIVLLNCTIGLNTPPVGAAFYLGCAIGEVSVSRVVRSIWPFMLALWITLLIVTLVPGVSMFVHDLFQ
jgi:2-dehydro-3-deoxygluconokinase